MPLKTSLRLERSETLHYVGVCGEEFNEPVEGRNPPFKNVAYKLPVRATLPSLIEVRGVLSSPVRIGDEQGLESAHVYPLP